MLQTMDNSQPLGKTNHLHYKIHNHKLVNVHKIDLTYSVIIRIRFFSKTFMALNPGSLTRIKGDDVAWTLGVILHSSPIISGSSS